MYAQQWAYACVLADSGVTLHMSLRASACMSYLLLTYFNSTSLSTSCDEACYSIGRTFPCQNYSVQPYVYHYNYVAIGIPFLLYACNDAIYQILS